MDVLTAMRVFVKVAEVNSYAHAAETLETSVPRISRIISELEDVTALTLVSRHLTTTDYYTCAAPEYVSTNGAPEHPSDLEKHPYLAFRTEHATDEIAFNAPDGTEISAA